MNYKELNLANATAQRCLHDCSPSLTQQAANINLSRQNHQHIMTKQVDHQGDPPALTIRIAYCDHSQRPTRPFATPCATVRNASRDRSHRLLQPASTSR